LGNQSEIAEKQEAGGWGTNIVEKLAKDLQNSFPGIEGFSRRNIFRMRSFYLSYQKVPQLVAQIEDLPIFRIPWGHNALLLEKVKNPKERLWYAQQTIQNGWSRSSLEDWIKADLYKKKGKAVTNFTEKLPDPQSRLAQETLKDPYNFDFLSLTDGYKELELEQGLIDHIQKFLIELGQGFAFLGSQYPITVDGDVHYIDLLFYHVKLHCYVVVELKAGSSDPRDAGQMNFYLSAVDAMLKSPQDNPSIGLLLCKDKKGLKVEYALQGIRKPIGVASYEVTIVEKLPKELKGSLPTVQEIEAELENM
jgi:predicted nuclease of restriction endonuclease-like (RecB) superfamily